MSDPRTRLAMAELDAVAARERLSATVSQLQARLDPQLLADDARQMGLVAARASLDGARNNPAIVAGVVATTGLLLVRHRITALFGRRRNRSVPAVPITHSKDK